MISALVVSYNTRGELRRCLERLAAELGPDDETIVVDNASDDDSAAMVERDFPACRLLRLPENLGFGAANNRGAEAARGDALLLLNSDAWLAPGALDLLRRRLDEDERLALVAPQLRYPDGRLQFAWSPETGVLGEAIQMARNRFEDRPWCHGALRRLLRTFLGPGWYSAACVLVRKAAFDQVGGFDEGFFLYFEDVDLSRRLRRAGWRLTLEPGATAFHVKGASRGEPEAVGTASDLAYRRSQVRYYRLHRPVWEYRVLRRRLRRKLERIAGEDVRRELIELIEKGEEDV